MGKNKTHLQCGYEDKCKEKDCLNCPKKKKHSFFLTIAEECVIEDFAIGDLPWMLEYKPKELSLMQNVCFKIMEKVFKEKWKIKETQQKKKRKRIRAILISREGR